MSDGPAEALAQDILEGRYTPGTFVDCDRVLPPDRNPHVVRFQQFILFATPRLDVRSPKDPAFLILQQYEPTAGGRRPIFDKAIKPLAGSLRAGLGRRPGRGSLVALLEPLRRAGFSVAEAMAATSGQIPGALEGVLTQVLLPEPFQPIQTPHPHFALCATFEQVWEPKGYTRGELVSSISLAPGEQVTLEIHSWDKSTIKSEDELATESELRVSENLTQRDVHTVSREVATQMSGGLTASGATIPGVPATFGGNVSGSVTRNTKSTAERIRERTVQASQTLKSTRKVRIEVSREVGREQRQTRIVANTNRCHTLNCHYFEIVANYLVTTRRVSLEPCLLVPMPTVEVTAPWVLCHEGILKEVLLDRSYLDGFDAARLLEASEEFEEIVKEAASEDVEPYVEAILTTYQVLLDAVAAVQAQSGEQLPNSVAAASGHLGAATAAALNLPPEQLRRMLYMCLLATDRVAWNALEKLKRELHPTAPPDPPPPARYAIDALKDFVAVVGPADYRAHWNSAMETGLSLLGLSPGLVHALVAWRYLMLVPDDAGLFNAVKAASKKMKAMAKAAEEAPAGAPEGFPILEVAKARVAFHRLQCHIEDNRLHYMQAMWARENSDQRFLRLQSYGAVAAVLENNLRGFLGSKAAFPITDRAAVGGQIDFDTIIGNVAPEEPAVPQLVTLPTQGTLLDAIVGECDACEEFIQQSRLIDLRVQEAKAKAEESEAERYGKRIEAGDYTPPGPLGGGKVVVTVDGGQPA